VGTRAGQLTLIDVSAFLAWMEAELDDKPKLAEQIRHRVRPEFKPAFEEWLAMNPLHDEGAPPSPFALSSYAVAERQRSEHLAQQAEQLFADGEFANAETGHYMLCSLIFAMALFFAGVGHQFHKWGMQLLMLGASAALIVAGTYRLLVLPTLVPGPVPEPAGADDAVSMSPRTRAGGAALAATCRPWKRPSPVSWGA
jgi:hypothetical protein